ncbi:MAG: DMT family transporter [Pseudomonadota bacterium]
MIRAAIGGFATLPAETRGALAMVVATFFFIAMDSVAKALGDHLPPMMVVWARYASQSLLLVICLAPSLGALMRTQAPGLQVLRGVLLFTVTALFFTALSYIPLAEAIALTQSAPLFVTLLATLVLGERVGPRRWAAVVVGLVGALLIVLPEDAEMGFRPASLLALSAAVCFAGFQVLTRHLANTAAAEGARPGDGVWTTMLYTSLVGTVLASATLPWTWVTPVPAAWPGMVAIGAAGLIGHAIFVWAAGQVPASVLAPFNYLALVWATLAGLVIFGEQPSAQTLLGAAIIVGAGLYVWQRERRLAGVR